METRALVMAVMVAIVLISGVFSLVLGASLPIEVNVEITVDEFMNTKDVIEEVVVPDGGVLTVSLGFDPASGINWTQAADISNINVLQQIGNKVIIFEEQDIVGLSGNYIWTFRTLQKGVSKIYMEYIQPGENGKNPEWTFELNVVVK